MRKANVFLRNLSVSQCSTAFAAALVVCAIAEWGLGGRHARWNGRPVLPVACVVLLQAAWIALTAAISRRRRWGPSLRFLFPGVSFSVFLVVFGPPVSPEKVWTAVSAGFSLCLSTGILSRGLSEPSKLEAHIRRMSNGFTVRTGIAVDFESTYCDRLPEEAAAPLLRIAQEALTHVAWHAGAKHVRVLLEPRGSAVHLSIEDDGTGLAPDDAGETGITLMRESARDAGGELSVRSRPGEGLSIEAWVPVGSPLLLAR